MRSSVFSVTCTCGWRKLSPALAANPLLAALALLAAAGAPGLALWAGSRLSAPFAAAAAQPAFHETLAVAVAVSAVVAGASVALLAPGPEALGSQVAAAPRSRRELALGAVVGPVCIAGAALALVLACFALPLAGVVGVALVLLLLACAALGAALGEGGRLVAAGEPAGAAALAGVAFLWAAPGLPSGAPALGPPAALATATAWGLAALFAVGAGGLALWVAASGVARRERAPTRAARLRRLPARACPAVAVATARRVLRHPELRLHGLTAVVLPVAASTAARLALDVGGAATTVFCVAVALTATALYPPAALGLARGARWLLGAAPRRRSALAGAVAVGGVGAAAGVVAGAALLAAPFGVPDASVYLQLEGASAFVLGCAALAGAVVVWHPDRVLNQLASYAAVLAVVVAAWLVVGRLEPVASGSTAFGVAVGNAVLLVGVGAAAAVSR